MEPTDRFGVADFGIFNPSCTPEQMQAIQASISKKNPEIQELFAIFLKVRTESLQECGKSLLEFKKRHGAGDADFVACVMMILARQETIRKKETWASDLDLFKREFRLLTLFHLRRELPPEAVELGVEVDPKGVQNVLDNIRLDHRIDSVDFVLELPREQSLIQKVAELCAANADDPLCAILKDGVRKFHERFMAKHGEKLKQFDPSKHNFKTDVLKEMGLDIPNLCTLYFVKLLGKACGAFDGNMHDRWPEKFGNFLIMAASSKMERASQDSLEQLEKLAQLECDSELQACASFALIGQQRCIEKLEEVVKTGHNTLRRAAVVLIGTILEGSEDCNNYLTFLDLISKKTPINELPANDFIYYYLQVVLQPAPFLDALRSGRALPKADYAYRHQYSPTLAQFFGWMLQDPAHRDFKAQFLDIMLQNGTIDHLLPKDPPLLKTLGKFCMERANELHQSYREKPDPAKRTLIYKYYMLAPQSGVLYFSALAGRIDLMYQHWITQVGPEDAYERIKDMRKEARRSLNDLANRCFSGLNEQECAAAEEIVEKILRTTRAKNVTK